MSDDRRAPADYLPEARRRSRERHPDDPLAAEATAPWVAYRLACAATVERRIPAERRCDHAEAQDRQVVVNLSHGSVACFECLSAFPESITGDEAEACDVCEGFSDRPLELEEVPLDANAVIVTNRLCDGCAASLAALR